MEDVSDKCWYCKAILPHHRRFGPLLRTTMSYEAIKRVFVSGIARRIRGSSKSNTSLLCILSRWKMLKSRLAKLSFGTCPSYRKMLKSRLAQLSFWGQFGPCPSYRFDYVEFFLCFFFLREIKDRFLDRIRGACNARGRSLRGPLEYLKEKLKKRYFKSFCYFQYTRHNLSNQKLEIYYIFKALKHAPRAENFRNKRHYFINFVLCHFKIV